MALIEKEKDGLATGGLSDFAPIANSDGSWPVGARKVFPIPREISTGEQKLETDPTSRDINASAMCRKVGDCLHLVMVGGETFSRYVEYMDGRPIVYNGSVFIREAIARSKRRGGAPTPHPCLEGVRIDRGRRYVRPISAPDIGSRDRLLRRRLPISYGENTTHRDRDWEPWRRSDGYSS